MRPWKIVRIVSILFVFASPTLVHAQMFDLQDFLTSSRWTSIGMTIDNDSLIRQPTDFDYTNGFRLTMQGWLSSQVTNHYLEDALRGTYSPGSISHFVEVSQNIYTPQHLEVASPILEDRPYAAWTRLGFYVSGKRTVDQPFHFNPDGTDNTTDYLGFSVGALGDAGGGFTQYNVHRILDWIYGNQGPPLPQGWANHVSERLAWYIVYDTSSAYVSQAGTALGANWGVQALSHSTTEIGNVFDRETLGFVLKGLFSLPWIPGRQTLSYRASKKGSDDNDDEFIGSSAFVKTNLILTAYNGTLQAMNEQDYQIYLIPVAINVTLGTDLTIHLGQNNLLYLRWSPLAIQSADFASDVGETRLLPLHNLFHGFGSVAIQYYWKQ